jgi:hypothetical protein
LWFGETERYVLRGGALEIEDLFAACRVSATRSHLERELIRGRRVDPDVLAGLTVEGIPAAPEIEVRRPTSLSADGRWRDAAAFLANRTDIVAVDVSGDRIAADTARADRVCFDVTEQPNGWRLLKGAGEYPFLAFTMVREGPDLSLRATTAPQIDPLAPGMRGRLAFDLRADLVALG